MKKINYVSFICFVLISLLAHSQNQTSNEPNSLSNSAKNSEKVAIIYNGGDEANPDLNILLGRRQNQFEELYKSNGYKVIVLNSTYGNNNPEGLKNAMDHLKNVADLKISLVGHGVLAPTTGLDPKRYPPIKFNALHKDAVIGPDISESNAYLMKGNNNTHLGLGDLRNNIKTFQKNNPQAQTSLMALNCYSGVLSEELSDLPKFQSYTSTYSTSVAVSCQQVGETQEGTDFINQFISGLCKKNDYISAQAKAHQQYIQSCKSSMLERPEDFPFKTSLLALPTNSLNGYVTKWCDKTDLKNKKSAQTASKDTHFKNRFENKITQPINTEVAELKELQERSCNNRLIQDLDKKKKAFNQSIWKQLKEDMKTEMSTTEGIQTLKLEQTIEETKAELDSFKKLSQNLQKSDPAYVELKRSIENKQSILKYQQELLPQTKEMAKPGVDAITQLDQCLNSHNFEVIFCKEPFKTVYTSYGFLKIKDDNPHPSPEVDPCMQKLGAEDKAAALDDFYDCRLKNRHKRANLLNAMMFPSATNTCAILKAKINLNLNSLNCSEQFLTSATMEEQKHLSQMMDLSDQKFNQGCNEPNTKTLTPQNSSEQTKGVR